jgi:hypothetical protein
VILALLFASTPVWAQDEYEEPMPEVGESPGADVAERELGASVGAAIGAGGVTPGGLRVSGQYLYQLSDLDWFDGGLGFTFGSGDAMCFRDRADALVCDHGAADGMAIDLFGGVRRFFGGQDGFRPWVRPGVGVRMSRFGEDELTGFTVFVSAGGGVRARVAERVAIGGHAALELGGGYFGNDYGAAVQVGLTVGADVEVTLP